MVLVELPVVVDAVHVELPLHALVDEHVLAPAAGAGTQLPEVLDTLAGAGRPCLHGVSREDLQRPMHPELAVVQVHAGLPFSVVLDNVADPGRQEHGIRVDLHRPIVVQEAALFYDLGPDRQEDARVKRRAELASHAAMQGAVDDAGKDPGDELHPPVAEHPVLVTLEDAGLLLELHCDQALLVALRLDEREAVQGLAHRPLDGLHRRSELVALGGQPGLVVRAGHPGHRPRIPALQKADAGAVAGT
mmetsp:Transcript_115547/g.323037  ORF Transcript_115547/g.323037 Transcript_115547/m.323037 type:complete len:247 (-) Transcript_115547:203-943(-)